MSTSPLQEDKIQLCPAFTGRPGPCQLKLWSHWTVRLLITVNYALYICTTGLLFISRIHSTHTHRDIEVVVVKSWASNRLPGKLSPAYICMDGRPHWPHTSLTARRVTQGWFCGLSDSTCTLASSGVFQRDSRGKTCQLSWHQQHSRQTDISPHLVLTRCRPDSPCDWFLYPTCVSCNPPTGLWWRWQTK